MVWPPNCRLRSIGLRYCRLNAKSLRRNGMLRIFWAEWASLQATWAARRNRPPALRPRKKLCMHFLLGFQVGRDDGYIPVSKRSVFCLLDFKALWVRNLSAPVGSLASSLERDVKGGI